MAVKLNIRGDSRSAVGAMEEVATGARLFIGAKIVESAAAAVSALAAIPGKAITIANELNVIAKEARSFGTTAEEIQLLDGALALLTKGGISASDVIKKLSRNLAEARDGSGPAKDALDKLGLSAEVLARLPVTEQLDAISRAMPRLRDGADRTQVAMDLLGRAGADVIAAFKVGPTAFSDAAAQIAEVGVASGESAEQAEAMADANELLSRKLDTLKREALAPLIPIISQAAEGATRFLGVLEQTGVISAFGRGLSALASVALNVSEAVLGIDTAIKKASSTAGLAGIDAQTNAYNDAFDALKGQEAALAQIDRELAASIPNSAQAARLTEERAEAAERIVIAQRQVDASQETLALRLEVEAMERQSAADEAERLAAAEERRERTAARIAGLNDQGRGAAPLPAAAAADDPLTAGLIAGFGRARDESARMRGALESDLASVEASMEGFGVDALAAIEAQLQQTLGVIGEAENALLISSDRAAALRSTAEAIAASDTAAENDRRQSQALQEQNELLDMQIQRYQTLGSVLSEAGGLAAEIFERTSSGAKMSTAEVVKLIARVVAFGATTIAQIASTAAAGSTAAATTAATQVASNSAIASSAGVAGALQSTATFGASAGAGAAAFAAVVPGLIATVASIVGSIAGVGDEGFSLRDVRRAQLGGRSIIMRPDETIVSPEGSRRLDRMLQAFEDPSMALFGRPFGRGGAAGGGGGDISVDVDGENLFRINRRRQQDASFFGYGV